MIVYVGDKPSTKMKPNAEPFKGAACEKRLMSWIEKIGVQPYYLINRVDSGFEHFTNMMYTCGVPIVALGREASKALDRIKIRHYELIHPSGRNRILNNKKYVEDMLENCKIWLKFYKNDPNKSLYEGDTK